MSSSVSGSANEIKTRARDISPAEVRRRVFWRVEGSLLDLTAVRPVGFFSWNAQTFLERWSRRGAMGVLAVARPLLYCTNRVFATRVLHMVLRGVSRDRLDLLGEEYFEYILKPRLKQRGVAKLHGVLASGDEVVLVSQGIDHIMRPLANHLGVKYLSCNRLDFRDGICTGRLLSPVIRPRGLFARLRGHQPDGRIERERLLRHLGFTKDPATLEFAMQKAARQVPKTDVPVVHFDERNNGSYRSVREALRGKHILLIGGTGFIGKVWLAQFLNDLPEIGRVTLLIRGHKTATALERFQRVAEESPVFQTLAARYGDGFADFLRDRVDVVDGDSSKPGLGLAADVRARLASSLDVVINSAGLTDFNPDLRDALGSNVRAMAYLLEFLKSCDHAALLHLSTCYVVGRRDGRVMEELRTNYTPREIRGFDAVKEWESLEKLIAETEARANSPEGHRRTAPVCLEEREGREGSPRRRAGKSNSQESRALAAADTHGSGNAARKRARLAEHLYPYEEPCRIANQELFGCDTGRCDCCRAAGDCGVFDWRAVHWLERGNQHIGLALVFARNVFPPIAHE